MGKRRGLCILVDINKPAQINDYFSVLFVLISSELIEDYCEYLLSSQVWNQDYYIKIEGFWRGCFGFFSPQKFFVYNNRIAQIAIVIRRKINREIFHGLCYAEGQTKLTNYFCYHKLKFIITSGKPKFKSEDRQMRLMRDLEFWLKVSLLENQHRKVCNLPNVIYLLLRNTSGLGSWAPEPWWRCKVDLGESLRQEIVNCQTLG